MTTDLNPRPGRSLLGREIRASNDDPAAIAEAWDGFFERGATSGITGHLSEDVYAVYSEYEGDETQPYSYFIGCEVEDDAPVPPRMASRVLPDAKFEVFVSEGKQPAALMQTWAEIHAAKIERSFELDYEVHLAEQPGRVLIYIGVK
jgi:predicted transcriptional regulator YdeE